MSAPEAVAPERVRAELDHVMIVVADLDEAAAAISERHGLGSVFAGRHPGLGTANRIIPFGRTFLELLAIVDHDEFVRGGLRLPEPECFGGWSVRAERIDDVAERLGVAVSTMSRRRDDGVLLEWRIAGLELFGVDPAQPMVLDWSADDDWHPARLPVAHRAPVEDIAWIEVSAPPGGAGRWRDVVPELDIRVVEGAPGVRAVGLATRDGEIELRYDG